MAAIPQTDSADETEVTMSIRQQAEPVPLGECISLLDYSDELDKQLRLRLAAFREGYAAAEARHADDYDRGYVDGVLARKRTGIRLYEEIRLEQRRWELRGEKRTRQTFGQPHPDDSPQAGVA